LELSDGNIASASADNTIKIWNAQNGQSLQSHESHSDEVWHLEQLNNGSTDNTIKFWQANTGELLKTIDIGEEFHSFALLKR
jgi:WD40 repeat protein